jgi:O-antigen/teichoic acid export membrane protein
VSTGVAALLAMVLLRRDGHLHGARLDAGHRRELRRHSLPFAAQELFSVGIARGDAVLLAALASATVVGLYGAGYRLLESTLFIPLALQTAFAAMFTYLQADGDPPIRAVYQRAIKLALVLLVPCAVTFFVLAHPLLKLLFGDGFGGAVAPLRILSPVVVLLGIVLLSTSLVVSRRDPRAMVPVFGVALVVNIAINVALIPSLHQSGAAVAMLVTEAFFAVVVSVMAARTVGALELPQTFGPPLLAGAAMAVPMVLLSGTLAIALPAGLLVYAASLTGAERVISPHDLRFAIDMVRRRLPSRSPGRSVTTDA